MTIADLEDWARLFWSYQEVRFVLDGQRVKVRPTDPIETDCEVPVIVIERINELEQTDV